MIAQATMPRAVVVERDISRTIPDKTKPGATRPKTQARTRAEEENRFSNAQSYHRLNPLLIRKSLLVLSVVTDTPDTPATGIDGAFSATIVRR